MKQSASLVKIAERSTIDIALLKDDLLEIKYFYVEKRNGGIMSSYDRPNAHGIEGIE